MKPKTTKLELLAFHLLEGKSITGLEAIKLFGYYRLSDGILKLRDRGWNIKTDMVQIDNGPLDRDWETLTF